MSANNLLDDLTWRGLIFQKTPGIEKVFERTTTIYLGIDPTADSLHIGHLLGFLVLKRALNFGSKIITLVGGGTSLIGDPSGKDTERPILPKDTLEENKEKLQKQISRIFNGQSTMVDNADWLERLTLIEFLRDIGKHIAVNTMLDKETVKARISRQEGISYAEFSYQLLQGYDFLKLFEKYSCEVQIGGSDQWGNMIQGVELIRKKLNKQACALSYPLIVNPKTGKKFGKTEKGEAIWLDPDKTHPFAFYQFLVNIEDELAPSLIRYFSFKLREEIEKIESEWQKDKQGRLIQKELAYELTSMIHGKEAAEQAKKVTEILFHNVGTGHCPVRTNLSTKDLEFIKKALPHKDIKSENEMVLENILPELGLVASKGEVKRLVQQNGVKVDKLFNKYFLIRKGKKEYGIVEIVQ